MELFKKVILEKFHVSHEHIINVYMECSKKNKKTWLELWLKENNLFWFAENWPFG